MFTDINYDFDISRGVDIMRGKRVVQHLDGPMAVRHALLIIEGRPGYYIRFWGKKSE